MVTSDAGAPELGYVFAPIPGGAEHPLFRYDPVTGEAIYYLQDSMGSVIGLVDQTTTQTATFEYDGFGGERASTGTLAGLPVASRGDYRFHGMWLDSSVGLYYVRARVYDAGVGRFLSNDPAEGGRGQPETFAAARFARGDSFRYADPTGAWDMRETSSVAAGVSQLAQTAVATINFIFALRGGQSGLRCATHPEQCTQEDLENIAWGALALAGIFSPFLAPIAATLTSGSASARLAAALILAGETRPANTAAHHIVAHSAPAAAPARAVLAHYGIDINSALNGVFLPRSRVVAVAGSATHSTLHTNAYYDFVNSMLAGCRSRPQAEAALRELAELLRTGML
jgi:RHS repeat-associated protein